MAGAGWRTFTSGAVLTAAQVQTFLQDQVVQVYASSAARSSALGTAVSAGMVSYRADGSVVEFYNGSAWSGIAPTSALTVSTVTAYTAVAGDANDTFVFTAASAVTVVVPDVFNVGDRVDIIRDGAGTVSIAAGTGVTTWAGAGTAGTAKSFAMGTQYAAASVIKVAANSYRVIGAVA
jgi:hypothetical protein